MIYKTQCKQNDNYIKIDTENELIMFGCDDAPEYGETVIDIHELFDAIFEAGYSLE